MGKTLLRRLLYLSEAWKGVRKKTIERMIHGEGTVSAKALKKNLPFVLNSKETSEAGGKSHRGR